MRALSVPGVSQWIFMLVVYGVGSGLVPAGAEDTHGHPSGPSDPRLVRGALAPVLDGLGDHHHPVTTTNPRAQRFFDQGLRLAYGFNHHEALRAFQEAARLDPECAMAYWGQAFVLGPNLNMPMGDDGAKQAYEAVQKAVALRDRCSPAERAYIDAMAKRFASQTTADRSALDRAYADAMAQVAAIYPEDLDAQVLYGDALMNCSPWNYWTKDGVPRPDTPIFIKLFQDVIARDPNHPGANHYLIHAVEAVHPELAVESADRLGALMPSAGHMVHMPSHIYINVGRFADAAEANEKAVLADRDYITQCRAQGLYPLAYHPHNYHFLWATRTWQGQSEAAIDAARKTAEKIPDHALEGTPSFQTFTVAPMYALVRFNRWDEILSLPKPDEEHLYTTGVWHYARGMACVGKGKYGQARRELKNLRSVAKDPGLEQLIWMNPPAEVLAIAVEALAGELEAARGRYEKAIAHLDRAVRLQDALPYNEPPEWHYPMRHSLGAVLLDAGYAKEAEVVYWADLRRNPENGWALFGLLQTLRAQGAARAADADAVEARLKTAWADSDVELLSSRTCRPAARTMAAANTVR